MTGLRALKQAMLIVGIASSCWAGCTTSPEDVRIPVEGTVFLGDKPATNGAVILRPDAAKGNASKHEPRGMIGADGKFQAETTLQKGAPVGWYKIGVHVTEHMDPKEPYIAPKSLIAKKYNDPDTSGLSLEVVKTPAAGAYDIKLDPKASDSQ
jgi:hypothetical protein